MPHAICPNQHVTYYPNGRNSYMPDDCPTCGQPLRRARRAITKDDNGRPVASIWEPVPQRQRARVICHICGRSRYTPSPNVRRIDRPTAFHNWIDEIIIVPAGTYICWHHRPVED